MVDIDTSALRALLVEQRHDGPQRCVRDLTYLERQAIGAQARAEQRCYGPVLSGEEAADRLREWARGMRPCEDLFGEAAGDVDRIAAKAIREMVPGELATFCERVFADERAAIVRGMA